MRLSCMFTLGGDNNNIHVQTGFLHREARRTEQTSPSCASLRMADGEETSGQTQETPEGCNFIESQREPAGIPQEELELAAEEKSGAALLCPAAAIDLKLRADWEQLHFLCEGFQ